MGEVMRDRLNLMLHGRGIASGGHESTNAAGTEWRVKSSVRRKLRLLARPKPRPPGRRLRVVAVVVLLVGFSSAGLVYWLETSMAKPTLEDLIPGTRAADARQVGILYGRLVRSVWEVYQDLKRPAAQGVMIAVISGLVAAGCLRAAWLSEQYDDT
jgi:hypothetical protein